MRGGRKGERVKSGTLARITAPPILWTPSPEWVERAALTGYTSWIEEKHGLPLPDYAALGSG